MAANARVSSFSRLLGKYYRSIAWAAIFLSRREGRLFMTKISSSIFSASRRFHDYPRHLVVGATALGSTNFASFGYHSLPFTIFAFSRGQSMVSRGLTPRHWPPPFSLPFSFFDSYSLSPPWERRGIEWGEQRQRRKGGGKVARRRNCTVLNGREEARWEMARLAELPTVCGVSVFNRMRDRYVTFPGRKSRPPLDRQNVAVIFSRGPESFTNKRGVPVRNYRRIRDERWHVLEPMTAHCSR